MLKATCSIIGISPLSFSKMHETPKESGETQAQYDERTWRNSIHVDENDNVFIPAAALKKAISSTARYIGERIPGKSGAMYTKHFVSGIGVFDNLIIPGANKDDIPADRIHVESNGVGKGRIVKLVPTLSHWTAKATIYIFDDILIQNPAKVKEYVEKAGQFNGLGFHRPERGGFKGRFKVENWKVESV